MPALTTACLRLPVVTRVVSALTLQGGYAPLQEAWAQLQHEMRQGGGSGGNGGGRQARQAEQAPGGEAAAAPVGVEETGRVRAAVALGAA